MIVDGLDTRHHPLYSTWAGIVKRCYSPNNRGYKNYGARGITMCDRWRYNFAFFVADMGPKPTSKHSIDRINNDGPYSPENCRWATSKQQCNNYRENTFLVIEGRRQTITQWCEERNVPVSTAINRLYRQKWTPEQAFGFAPQPKWRKLEGILPKGWTVLAKKAGLKHQTVQTRVIKFGWSLEKALSTPLQATPFISLEGKSRWNP